MSTYLIVDISVHDPEGFAGYAAASGDTVAAHGGRYLVRGAEPRVVEGEWQPPRMSIVEFPDAAAASAWYGSDAYQEIAPIRHATATTNAVFVDGPS